MATATQRGAATSRRTAQSPNGKASDSQTTQAASQAGENGGEGSGPRASAAARRARSSAGRPRSSRPRAGSSTSNGKEVRRTRGRASTTSRTRSGSNGQDTSARERATETISSAASNVRDTAVEAGRTIGVPVATGALGAAAGIAGGVLLGRTIAKRPKKVLGIKIPRRQADFSDVTRSINAAGKQFGQFASEVRAARQKAEEIGKALT